MLEFHETLERFFRKNYNEEIQRLSFEIPAERTSLSRPGTFVYFISNRRPLNRPIKLIRLYYSCSIFHSSPSTSRIAHNAPQSPLATFVSSASQPTRLQKHMAHLARHGMNAVASGPGEGVVDNGIPRSDSLSVTSPQGSFVNVTGAARAVRDDQRRVHHGKYQWVFQEGSLLAAWDAQLWTARRVGAGVATWDAEGCAVGATAISLSSPS
jgi:hypothetical protein